MKKLIIRLIILGAIVGAAWGGYRLVQTLPQKQDTIATAKVQQGDIVIRTFARGELRAVRSAQLTAPNLFGTVQVTRLAEIGAFAKEKDLVVEFDDAELQSSVEEKQLEIDQIDEQYKKSEADLAIRNNQDQVELLRSRYSVRRSELEVKRNELLGAIDQKRNELNLEESRRRLKQLESDIKSRQEQAEAELAVLRERKQKALLEMARSRSRLTQVKLLSPMSGLVAVRQNISSRMGFGFDVPDIREGDQVQPGMPIADVLDLSELEVVGRVGELDRANLSENQEVIIALDALPNERVRGKIKTMSSTASANVNSSDPAKKFDVIFNVDMQELLTKLGAKPDQIQKIMATAEANRKKPGVTAGGSPMGGMGMFAMGGAPGGMPSGMPGGMQGGGPGGDPSAAAGGGGFGGPGGMRGGAGGEGGMRGGAGGEGGARGGFGGMSSEDRAKMREAMQAALKGRNMQDLSAEERTKIMQEVMAKVRGGAAGTPGAGRPAGAKPEAGATAGAEGGGRRGRGEGGGGRRGGGEGGMPAFAFSGMGGGAAGRFTQADLDNAKLPPPPDQDSSLDVLLRPGLLADVEIIVEKIPNAIHVPAQAVFERDGKLVVFVKEGSKFVARPIKLAKRSESTLVVASGLKKDEIIAMADPEAKPGTKQKSGEKGGSGGPMNALPGGKS